MNPFNLGKDIRRISRNVKKRVNAELEQYPIAEGQLEYLIMIHDEEGINQKELADRMNVGKASVTKAVKILEEEGLVDRRVDLRDQRNYGLFISDRGRPYIELFQGISCTLGSTLFDNFTLEELETLKRLIDKLKENSMNL